MSEPRLQVTDSGGKLRLDGPLNEFTNLSAYLTRTPPLILNLGGVNRLNSIGIRHFLKFINDWGARPLVYEECPSEFVDQINMVPGLLGARRHAEVRSLSVPFVCEDCDREQEVLCTLDQCRAIRDGAPGGERRCGQCGQPMELLSDGYFAFIP